MSDDKQDKPMTDEGKQRDDVVDKKSVPKPPAPKRSWTRWILPAAALMVLVVLGIVVRDKLRDEVYAYYTDGEGLRVEVQEKKERMVLWQDPKQNLFQEKKPDPENPDAVDPINQPSKRVEAAFSADGTMMVLTLWSQDFEKTEIEETGADLYLSTWDGRKWSRPVKMVFLNTFSNERGAAFSRDGQYLYFSSDRKRKDGSGGGYDIYVALFNGETWTEAKPLSDSINSARNETGPAPSADDKKLYFSTDRDTSDEVQDIYVALRVVTEIDSDKAGSEAKTEPEPPVPVFAKAEPVSSLNSDADDIEAALTGRGDHVFLASDRDRDDQSGYGLYLSRVINGVRKTPEKVDVYIKKGNATDPAVRWEGFDLLFSADGDLAAGKKKTDAGTDAETAIAAAEPRYRPYRSTTREVIGYTDMNRWEEFKKLMYTHLWWYLLALVALIALIYLLERWRDITNLYHKCLAASAVVNLLLLLWLAFWWLPPPVKDKEPPPPEIAISVDALAQEELAMESQQELVQVALTTQLILSKNPQEFPEPDKPTKVVTNTVPIVRKSSDQSLVSDFKPSKASESTPTEIVPQTDAPELRELTPTELPELQVEKLEEADETIAKKTELIDPTKGDFKPNEKAVRQIKTEQEQIKQAKSQKVDVQSDAKSVPKSSQPAPTTDTVTPIGDLEADDSPRKPEASRALAKNLPGQNPVDGLTKGLELKVPARDPSEGNFNPDGGAIGKVKSGKGQTGDAENSKLNVESGTGSVPSGGNPAPTTNTGGSKIHPNDGIEADGSPPKLKGTSTQAALAKNLPGSDPIDTLTGVKLETPEHALDGKALSKYIKKLRGKPSLEVIKHLGGSNASELAIGLALDWFSDHQEPDGHWDMGKYESKSEYNTSGAGLALLCYYGWDIKHGTYDKSKQVKHSKALTKALDWLLKQQKENGDLSGKGRMYCHGIASIALCEAYGLTKDPKLKEPAIKAIDYILKAQHAGGGWRYQPGQKGDLSVVGWQYLALHSAQMADLEVPDEVFAKTDIFMDSVSGGKQGGLYGYMGPSKNSPAMTACGMFMRQLDLAPPTDPRMQESAAFIKAHMLKAGKRDLYYEYYATLAMYQHQGPIWLEWNENLQKAYVAQQEKKGENKGSWDPKLDGSHAKTGGRVLTTALAVQGLEVYYKILPLYGIRREEVKSKPAAGEAQRNPRLKKIKKIKKKN